MNMDRQDQDDNTDIENRIEQEQLDNPRIRTLTQRGKEQYESVVDGFIQELRQTSSAIDEQIHSFVTQEQASSITTEKSKQLKDGLEQNLEKYQRISGEFSDYLERSRCSDSMQELSAHKMVAHVLSEKVNYALNFITDPLSKSKERQHVQNNGRTPSQVSQRSQRSHASSRTSSRHSSYLKQKMKSEAARCRLQFAELEAQLELDKTKIEEEENIAAVMLARRKKNVEININLLAAKRDAMEAQVELKVIQEEYNSETGSSIDLKSEIFNRTKQYIIEQSSISSNLENIENAIEEERSNNTFDESNNTRYNSQQEPEVAENIADYSNKDNTDDTINQHINVVPATLDLDVTVSQLHNRNQTVIETEEADKAQRTFIDISNVAGGLQEITMNPVLQNETANKSLLSTVSTNEIIHGAAMDCNNNANLNVATEFSRLFMKKELLFSRLTSYNDKPENYLIWKASFSSIMRDIQVTPSEEMDLLVRWLGIESSKQAVRLRASNTHDPKKGLERIWNRLNERYGSPELIESTLKDKILKFGKMNNTDHNRLYELGDLLAEIDSIKEDPKYSTLLGYFDSSSGVNPIVCKLPYFLQTKWTDRAVRYKTEKCAVYPPFKVFVKFIQEMCTRLNDPSFNYDRNPTAGNDKQSQYNRKYNNVSTKKTEVAQEAGNTWSREAKFGCPLHEQSNHSLNECKQFRRKPIDERKTIIMQNGICFKCCNGKHLARNCNENHQCKQCQSKGHPDALHIEKGPNSTEHGGEQNRSYVKPVNQVKTTCTQICGDSFKGRSCAKTVLVKVYPNGHPEKAIRVYAILDDQSNRTLATSQFFDLFNINGQKIEYTLSSCAGSMSVSGRMACDFTVESFDGSTSLDLPTLIECNDIPNVREEIPTPNVAFFHDHLRSISCMIPPLDSDAQILLLIGRDLGEAHHVYDQRTGPRRTPYAQKLALGWVVIGETCLGKVHVPDKVNVNKTIVLQNGRTSIFKPCTSDITIKEQKTIDFIDCEGHMPNFGTDVFVKTRDDDKVGLSIEDRQFQKIMESGFIKTDSGNWSAPLPFKNNRPTLPNNFQLAYDRAKKLEANLRRNPRKLEHFCAFMDKIFKNGHAEVAQPLRREIERWYLPIFGVYHPKKPDKIRVVFDSSAKFKGISLNNLLMTGPDLTNSLLGVLIRFRKEKVAVTADIEQMFFNFLVHENHRDYLRFIWHRDNNPNNELIEYRMRVHVFGNSPSPAVATLGLRRSACDRKKHDGSCSDVCKFIQHNFYVDDGLLSMPDEESAVKLITDAQKTLKIMGNLRLHKITSNSKDVLSHFPKDDIGSSNTSDIEFDSERQNLQRSLGLSWNIERDTFTFQVSNEQKPFTKRGMLSTINSIFDPLGFVAPVLLGGKILLHNALTKDIGWDESMSEDLLSEWEKWKVMLKDLEGLEIPRRFSKISLKDAVARELHIFSDASKEAIGTVAYLKVYDSEGKSEHGFVMGKSKIAPSHGHTIPRLELCAAVLAVEVANFLLEHFHITVDTTRFYTDSMVVLGYINNETRRFYTYVSNRVDKIRKSSEASQWSYVRTHKNPADQATRPINASNLENSLWLKGPPPESCDQSDLGQIDYILIQPEQDKEVRPIVKACKTMIHQQLGTDRFSKFSSWKSSVRGLMRLRQFATKYHHEKHAVIDRSRVELYKDTEKLILKEVQRELYPKEVKCLKNKQALPRDSSILSLSPVLDDDGLLRVGGRLNRGNLSVNELNPIIISGKQHISTLLVRHYHEITHHQGRHITEGAVRSAGYWITGGKRLIGSILHNCVVCKKLRGKTEHQRMSDLPVDRVTPCPPFTYVGVDTFGPWYIVTRRMIGVTRRILDSMLRNVNKLTHEVLCTFMSEVCAIVNARPIVAVSTDPEAPTVLSPSSLMTQKTNENYECFDHIDVREMYRSQWKLVQILANNFWTKWKQQYLQNQQSRTKWCEERNNLKRGDIVLLKDNDLARNQWAVGVIQETFPSEDGRIRKVSVRITKNNNSCTYTRPITELVYLLSPIAYKLKM